MYQNKFAGSEFSLPADIVTLHRNSHDTLYDRITERGYAITSLTGTYFGMFPRDSSIQAMAHIACGQSYAARKILRYLLSYHVALDLPRTTHILENIKDTPTGVSYLSPEVKGAGMAQRNDERAIYLLNAPTNGAAQPFVACCDHVSAIEVSLGKTTDADTVNVMICTDYRDPQSAVCRVCYTFGEHPSGWQYIAIPTPVKLEKGKRYYLVITATEKSGRVVWNGTTHLCESEISYNYDLAVFGGWSQKTHHLAFEVLSDPLDRVTKPLAIRGNAVLGVDVSLFSQYEEAKVKAEIKQGNTSLATAEATVKKAGQSTLYLPFEREFPVNSEANYDLCVTVTASKGHARVTVNGVEAVFESDRQPLIVLDGKTAAWQALPDCGKRITGVRLLLEKDMAARGSLHVSLYKGFEDDLQYLDTKKMDAEALPETADFVTVLFDLPLWKEREDGGYCVHLSFDATAGTISLCGSKFYNRQKTYAVQNGIKNEIMADAGFELLSSPLELLSNFTQTDANFMLLHAWAMYRAENDGEEEDEEFLLQSYPVVRDFANYYLDTEGYYNSEMNLILSPSLEHSRLGRYWIAYDLITNTFASQSLYELSLAAEEMGDGEMAEKWMRYAKMIEEGIHTHLVTEFDGKKIYAEFYDAEHGMQFYPGISWVNLAPVAAEWYAMDAQIMANTYEIYRKHGSVNMYGYDCPASEATLGTEELTREMIGKCIAWELMYCAMTGNCRRIAEILEIELETARRNGNTVYPECWRSEDYVTDPGNQEHCSWQFYAMSRVFPQLNPHT